MKLVAFFISIMLFFNPVQAEERQITPASPFAYDSGMLEKICIDNETQCEMIVIAMIDGIELMHMMTSNQEEAFFASMTLMKTSILLLKNTEILWR